MVSSHLVYQYFGLHSSKATGSFPALETSHYFVVPLKNFLNKVLDLCVAGKKGVGQQRGTVTPRQSCRGMQWCKSLLVKVYMNALLYHPNLTHFFVFCKEKV